MRKRFRKKKKQRIFKWYKDFFKNPKTGRFGLKRGRSHQEAHRHHAAPPRPRSTVTAEQYDGMSEKHHKEVVVQKMVTK